jgi:thiol:disulfide interchange protein DsbC
MARTPHWLLMVALTLSSAADADDAAAEAAAVAKLKALRPDLPIESVETAPLPGFVTIELAGGTLLYATDDGRYLFAGDLYELRESGLVNLADQRRAGMRRDLLARVPLADMVVFPAEGTRKAVISVFTDVDCGYCRKLHLEVPELNARGVEVRYLAYPRQGLTSETAARMVTAWCSSDRNDAITRLKRGESIPKKTCDNPVEREFELGHEIGVQGTPAIVFEDGTLHPGYASAADLVAMLGI